MYADELSFAALGVRYACGIHRRCAPLGAMVAVDFRFPSWATV